MSKTPDAWFAEYDVCHRHPRNKVIHWICVPLIMLSLLALLWLVPVPFATPNIGLPLNWATLFIAACLVFYCTLSFTLALGMAVASTMCVLIIQWYASHGPSELWVAAVFIFVVAWIGQFIGHSIEGRRPAFLQDLLYLLIGPIWILASVYRRLGIPY